MAWLKLLSFLALICEIFGDYCGENVFCHAPYKCCEMKKGCCYDNVLYSTRQIRPQLWNMWYFWFVIIFMLMSCFGGCGYYRRRRLAMLNRFSNHLSPRPVTVLEPVERRSDRGYDDAAEHFTIFAYNGPGGNQPEQLSNLPPPYAEVVSQPELYPINKLELPPYPGHEKPENYQTAWDPARSTVILHNEVSLPPPYSEIPDDPPEPSAPLIQNDVLNVSMSSHESRVEQPPSLMSQHADVEQPSPVLSRMSYNF